MHILYSTENLNTRRNLPFKNFFLENKGFEILNIEITTSYKNFSINRLKLDLILIILKKIRANYFLLKNLKKINQVESIVVVFPGIIDILFLKIFARKYRNKIIYDYFISIYQTIVEDRRLLRNRFLTKILIKIEHFLLQLPSKIIVETEPIKRYLLKTFNQNLKISVIFTPVNENNFNFKKLQKYKEKSIDFIYWGTFINLHGLEILLHAAKFKKDIYKIYLLGDGQEFQKIYELKNNLGLNNIVFDKTLISDNNKFEYFYNLLDSSRVVIGSLSDTNKNKIVITSKVMEAAAMKMPVITFYSECIDLYSMQNNAYYINNSNIEELAAAMDKAVYETKSNSNNQLVENSYNWFKKYGTINKFNQDLLAFVKTLK